jgi:MerR family transcriptional regulator, thiopeptide resistance regulator
MVAVSVAIESLEEGATMTPEERSQVFGDFEPEKYEAEAQQRWGGTDEYKASVRRTRSYRKQDWDEIKEEAGAIYAELGRLVSVGAAPSSAEALEVAERHRAHITRWFYPCSPEIHRGLGQMYVDDPRFTANIDRFGKGIAAFARDAFLANAERQGG